MSIVIESTTRSGLFQLRRSWPASDPWCRVLLVHGLNEHSGRYEHVGNRFAAEGVDVVGIDLQGFGRTWGERSYVDRFERFLEDVEDALADLRSMDPELPVMLLGHSMGGLVSVTYCADRRPLPDVLVTSGAWLATHQPDWQQSLARFLNRFLPKFRPPNSIDVDVLSRDPAVGEAYLADPLVPKSITVRLATEVFDTQDRVALKLPGLPLPSFHVHGGDDQLVLPSATERFDGAPQASRKVYDGMRHEVFNEFGWEGVVDDVLEWLRIELT